MKMKIDYRCEELDIRVSRVGDYESIEEAHRHAEGLSNKSWYDLYKYKNNKWILVK